MRRRSYYYRQPRTTGPIESAIIVTGLLLVLNLIAFFGIWR